MTRTDDPVPNGCSALDCSLREAVLAANASIAADSISLGAQTYTLSRTDADQNSSDETRGPLWVKSDVSIYGRGVDLTRVRWNTSSRHTHNVFRIDAGSSVRQLSLSAMTVSDGRGSIGGCIQYEFSSAISRFPASRSATAPSEEPPHQDTSGKRERFVGWVPRSGTRRTTSIDAKATNPA